MWKSLVLILLGICAGASAALFFLKQPPGNPTASPAIVVETIAPLSAPAAESARDAGFTEVTSIQDVLAFPGEFGKREAMHALAGRSNADVLQELIFSAERVSDPVLRRTLLQIVFTRLAEVDAKTALALVRVDPFANESRFEDRVWQTLARNDLDEALFLAKTQTTRKRQEDAAQSLFAAYEYMGNATTERIAEELGITQNRQTRLRYLRTLLEDNPYTAIEFINAEPSPLRRLEYLGWFASAIDAGDRNAAMAYAQAFPAGQERMQYEQLVRQRFAQLDPLKTLQQAFAKSSVNFSNTAELQAAFGELVSRDLNAALDFYSQLEGSQNKMMAAYFIATEYASADPQAALEWVRTLDGMRMQQLEAGILGEIARTDPEFAWREVNNLPNSTRSSAQANILTVIAANDQHQAMQLLAELPDTGETQRMRTRFGRGWLMQDADSAVAWLETLDGEDATQIINKSTSFVAAMNPDLSTRLLSIVDASTRAQTAKKMVGALAANGNVTDARTLMERFQGQEGFEGAELLLVTKLANSDFEQSAALALSIQDTKQRDQAIVSIAQTRAHNDARQAVDLLANISDGKQRRNAMKNIAGAWYQQDPDATAQWISGLANAAEKDAAAARVAAQFSQVGQRELNLVNGISDSDTRLQAVQGALTRLRRSDSAAASRLLESANIPADEKALFRDAIANNDFAGALRNLRRDQAQSNPSRN